MLSNAYRLRLFALAISCTLPIAACDSPAPTPPPAAPEGGIAPGKAEQKVETHTLPPIKN